MVKIYTRTGDQGETSLLGGRRMRKDDLRIEAIGSVDELNASLGVSRMEIARSGTGLPEIDQELVRIQHGLFDLGAELAANSAGVVRSNALSDREIMELETAIDRYEATLQPLREFVLPGGSPGAAELHVARCVCRRCERRLVELAALEQVRGEVLRYINRLGDFLFVAARAVNQANRVPDVLWEHGAGHREAE
ncbi:MAG TPA: cob(I)yrinic acid a,c-diamide adenosyltransferase [Lacipirellulaceae bacterium]|nr:cob(I)yrinic acid a,c-diamide adenosyltransferase [Lacipirellulaceae bacterium]